ncbi:class V chitinase [Apiospora phragmitis]|uniref:Class V chitinase n=1 Tax=Apiospora phragmitis TaxID=2905665 RepID=A0ABR1W629_9PEZI
MAATGRRVFGAAASCALLLPPSPARSHLCRDHHIYYFFSELSPCPASCGSAFPRDWTVYPSVSRLAFCSEPILFDLNLYNPVNDSSSGSNVRACTVGSGPVNTKSTRRETSDGGDDVHVCSSSVAPTTTALKFGRRGPTADAKDATSALNHVQEYLDSSTDCTKRIMLGASNGTIVGVYAGHALSKTAAQAVIQKLQSQAQLGASANMMAVQLCDGSRDRHHVLGAALSLDGDIAAVQAALAAWNNGTCAGGFDRVETLSPVGIMEAPQHRRNATAFLTSSNFTTHHSGHLLSRASGYCTTQTVEDGDSCWSLANACGISLDEFYKFTPADKCSTLQKGQKVCCDKGSLKPLPQDNGTCYTHTVEAGDNCYDIDLQWVAYMSAETKEARREKWKNLNFLGTIDWATDLQEFSSADSLGPSGNYDQDVCVNVFDDMIWDWVNPAVAAPVNCTNLLQPSPLPSVVTLTAFTTITFVSGGQISTTDISTVFPVSEVNFQPFTVGDADVVDGSVLVYHPVPRITADPIALHVPPGWTVTAAGGKPGETPPSATTIGLPHGQPSGAASSTTTTTTSSDAAGFLLIPWLPTVSYPLPPMVTPKIVAPTSLPPDDRRPVPAPPVPNVKDCTGPGCSRGDDCMGDDCIRGGDCIGPDCTAGGQCRGPACVRGGQCIGDKCTQGGGCEGDDCVEGGGCSGPSCTQGGGCKGSGCNKGGNCVKTPLQDCGSGGCTGPNCGCVGMWCANRITISVLPPPPTSGPSPPRPSRPA